jgi:hypothetical protein
MWWNWCGKSGAVNYSFEAKFTTDKDKFFPTSASCLKREKFFPRSELQE